MPAPPKLTDTFGEKWCLKIDHKLDSENLCSPKCNRRVACKVTINLYGVREYPIPLNTRMVLEKGLTIQGNSRSEREDFVGVVETLKQNPKLFEYLEKLVTQIYEINSLNDLKEAFDRDYISRFGKTILKWNK